MKVVLFVALIFVVSTNNVFARERKMFNIPNGLLESQYGGLAVVDTPDTTSQKLMFLPFNTSKAELAPALRNGWLYYVVNDDTKQRYYVFELESTSVPDISDTGKTTAKRKANASLKNVYLNFSIDGKKVLVNSLDNKSRTKKLYIGNSEYMSDTKQLEEFPFNSRKYSIGRATITPDGSRLVFSSDKKGTTGGIDLWMCRYDRGVWGPPENLGPMVNTKKNEAMPFFVSNTRLYFASEGHTGYGKYDLYYSDWGGEGFTPAVNMGSPVNSSGNETGICFSQETGTYYFASDRKGNYDIYSYESDVEKVNVTPLIASVEKKSYPVTKQNEIANAKSNTEHPAVTTNDSSTYSENSSTSKPKVPVITEPVDEEANRAVSNGTEDNTQNIYQYTSPKTTITTNNLSDYTNSSYYAIQVIALKPADYAKQYFRKLLDPKLEYFLVRENGWIEIRTGHFTNYKDAFKYARERGMKEYFVVPMDASYKTEPLENEVPKSDVPKNYQLTTVCKPSPVKDQYYSVQVMALKPEEYEQQYFKKLLNPKLKYFVVKRSSWVEIRTGRFTDYKKAFEFAKDQGLKTFFVVPTKDEQISDSL